MRAVRVLGMVVAGILVIGSNPAASEEAAFKLNPLPGIEPQAGPLVLVRDGKPVATIVIGTNATKTVKFAAAELNRHLKLCATAELPIVKDDAAVAGPTVQMALRP
ncbi:MAG: hypothetical protein JXR37_23385 [Kiritimatiellae bacterium]|nr:hypothetical protein [Kiritimatiellia bacterium]